MRHHRAGVATSGRVHPRELVTILVTKHPRTPDAFLMRVRFVGSWFVGIAHRKTEVSPECDLARDTDRLMEG